jgi:hypothetical protein
MILYILAGVILLIILFFIYIRIKYRFWALQPVFHFYDIYYWFVNVGIIRHELPEKNRYTNFKNITTNKFEEVTEIILKQIIILIQLNYLRNNENTFTPQKDNIVPYFIGHSAPTFWSYYTEPELLIDNKNGTTIQEDKIIGIITSRPLHVKINNKRKVSSFDVYYVDYLCVNRNNRKQNIAPQLIQTHEYNYSHQNRNISVSLFKREEELTGIIPLTVFKTYCFPMRKWGQPQLLEARMSLLTGDKQNMYYLYNFINETTNKWDILIWPEISNLIELVETKNLYIKMLVVDGEIEAAYIFRKTCTFVKKGEEIISCVASINGTRLSNKEFIQGFKMALWTIIEKQQNFQYLAIEDVSDNSYIIDNLVIKTHPLAVSPTAYFFYNFAYSPFKSGKCLIIN